MSNINLLPEEMRDKEKKEVLRAAKKPKIFTVDLSPGQSAKPPIPVKPSKPPRSLWSEIFGQKIKPTPIAKMPNFGPRMDMLETANHQKIKYPASPAQSVVKPTTNFFRSMGPAQSPIKLTSPAKPVPAQPSFVPPVRPVKTQIDYKFKTPPKKFRLGFWASFKKLFTRSPRLPQAPKMPLPISPPKPAVAARPSLEPPKPSNLKVDFKYNVGSKKKSWGFFALLKNLFARQPNKFKPVQIHKKEIEKKLPVPPAPPATQPLKVLEKTKEKFHSAPKAQKSKLDINLIPQELLFRKYPKSSQQIISILLAIILPALMITAIYTLIDQQQKDLANKTTKLNQDKENLITYISQFKNLQDKNIRLQDKLLVINKLLQKHIYWTKFFSLLERYTLDDVYYTEFTADTSGKFSLPAVATIGSGSTIEAKIADSYRQAAQQITAFKKAADFVSQVQVSDLEVFSDNKSGIKGVKFEINLALKDGVFYQTDN
ncbi:MAG: hypothetical protein COU81_00555 [Candidatus Portnoybacteria bacterium CG10_big_fil_rev_8_21_14_0_10_36_7]|uniref:Uncharacterized protein n=1 Tax=Candidatus Portnoybacteria bacterium CG10_big_fil_rev_8_21_14_0_10_36_7 TaxID=1974812 RepID=A0A2M8KEX5_9BACT|nr:MAG: hypothetical protein COU81_00555 [Candidatus Portnoybacteria bacterium CG10_big_fil_rev_8_21_14_0_10_36_7]